MRFILVLILALLYGSMLITTFPTVVCIALLTIMCKLMLEIVSITISLIVLLDWMI